MEWYRKLPFLEQPIPTLPVLAEGQVLPPDVLNIYTAWVKASKEIAGQLERLGHCHDSSNLSVSVYLGLREWNMMNPPIPKKDNPAKDVICHQCGKVGQWRRNCPMYLAELMKKKKLSQRASASGSQVSTNNLVYFCATPRDDVFEIDLSSSYTNDSSMYAISNKRVKLDLDSTLFWHCRLGHINKKRMEKLQHDGLFDSTDIKSFEKCVSCRFGKMARKPYSHQVERAKDLLGLIHTDVFGTFRTVSRQGASYFVTFTDDFSRYGYVYLLKHKHEVIETFKVFQKEVENQLGKTIKSLRSDRGGEYMSQDFLDHLKDHGIIRTPSYTSQFNGVSERRNQTLLDMVQSMMSSTTLPKSFWDYALESAARILNMVPTKKVDKTPYKVWHGQAPKLSYLKVWGYEVLVKRDILTKPGKLEPKSFSLIDQEASGSLEDLEIIQEEDTAMNVKMQSMRDNEVWEIVDLPPNGKAVGHKWLFKKKTDMDRAAILASSSEVPSVLEFLQRRKLEAKKEVAASEFSHLNHSLSHRPVSVKPDISKPDISKASSAGGKLHILKPSCERNGITPTPKESLSPTSGSKVPNSPLTGESNLLIVKASADWSFNSLWSQDVRGDPDSGIGGHWRSSDSGMYKFILILRALAVFRFRRALAVFRFRHAFTKNGIACIYLKGISLY
ncbi:retrotransposon protein, putative, ty1-copia subclass [Tanacetum coccineum]